jgi:NitT/TauT family transport system substrate-binding protein
MIGRRQIKMASYRSSRRAFLGGLCAASTVSSFAIGQSRETVTFATSWLAQAEQGGYYQAVVDGTYLRHGLDVSILPGGPQSNNRMMFTVGRIDFYMGTNLLEAFSAVEQNIPTVVLASIFQKDPQVLIAHPGQGVEKFLDLIKLPTIFVSSEGAVSYYRWLKASFGFRDEQVKRYTFNPQPFIADKLSAMQGYVTSEPFSIERVAGFKPKVFLLADQGYDTYANTIEAHRQRLAYRPETCQKFVEASIIGWYNYLYGDNEAANLLIKKHNPEITDAAISYAITQMKEHGIVDSEKSRALGIGSMTETTVESFFEKMVKSGVQNPAVDWRSAFDNRFVNKGLGKELRKAG